MDPALLPPSLRAKIDVSGECWIWTAAKDRYGYGRVRWGKGTQFAHRLVYSLLAGDPGPELDHLCRQHACVRPSHLEPVTHAVNVARGRGREVALTRGSEPRTCPHGHPVSGDNLYIHYPRPGHIHRQCRTCKREQKQKRRAAGKRD